MVMIGLLLTIGVVSFRSTQASSRDKERETDVSVFANHLETVYSKAIKNSAGTTIKPAGVYPPLPGVSGQNKTNPDFQLMLESLDKKALSYPGGEGLILPTQNHGTHTACSTWQSCYNQSVPTATQLTPGRYMYRPLTGNNYVCSTTARDASGQIGACRSFVIYYVLEGSPTVVRTLQSKRL